MTNADKFKSLFGIYATELWAMSEKDFLEWLNSEVSNSSESPNGWIPCSEYPEYDFQSVLVRWRDRRIGCENDYYLFEGYVVNRHWCCVFEDVDISFLEAIEWKMIKPYQPKEDES